jgi:hypothetical protein
LRRIDVWLAPSLGWLPARIVQTEPNGTQFELVWRGKLNADTAGSPPNSIGDASTASPDISTSPPAPTASAVTPDAAPSTPVDPTDPANTPDIIKP